MSAPMFNQKSIAFIPVTVEKTFELKYAEFDFSLTCRRGVSFNIGVSKEGDVSGSISHEKYKELLKDRYIVEGIDASIMEAAAAENAEKAAGALKEEKPEEDEDLSEGEGEGDSSNDPFSTTE